MKKFPLLLLSIPILSFASIIMAADGDLPTQPLIRVNTSMHISAPRSVAVHEDVESKQAILATASPDKTVKLWDLNYGLLLRTIRLPSNQKDIGSAYGLAFSPDGKTLAIGAAGLPVSSVYIYDVSNGEMKARIPGAGLGCMEFSPDGTLLAVQEGIYRVLDNNQRPLETPKLLKYLGGAEWISWAPSGPLRLASVTRENLVKVHWLEIDGDTISTETLKEETENGDGFACEFSPDGNQLAVISGSNRLEVFRVENRGIRSSFSLDSKNLNVSPINTIAWSRDGQRLVASTGGNDCPILVWNLNRPNEPIKWEGWPRHIYQLETLSEGRTVFAAEGPAWVLLNEQGNRATISESPKWSELNETEKEDLQWSPLWGILSSDEREQIFRGSRSITQEGQAFDYRTGDIFDLSRDGTQIRFRVGQHDNAAILGFSFTGETAMKITNNPAEPADGWHHTVQNPQTSPQWQRSDLETTDGLGPSIMRSVSTNNQFLVESRYGGILCYETPGRLNWTVQSAMNAWSINVSQDGRFVVAAYQDGSIHWYRLIDGQLLAVLWPHKNRKDFVCWTPEGYFISSPRGEKMIGWLVNKGLDQQPEFLTLSQLKSDFLDGDNIIRRVIEQCRSAEEIVEKVPSLDDALSGLPKVSFVDPLPIPRNPTVTVTIEARQTQNAEPVREISLYHNGTNIGSIDGRNVQIQNGVYRATFEVRLIPGGNRLKAVAKNESRTDSTPDEVLIRYEGRYTPKLWVLGVGVQEYQLMRELSFCVNDIRATKSAMIQRGSGLYETADRQIAVFENDEAIRSKIEQKFEEWSQLVHPGDLFVFVYAGHGKKNHENKFHLVLYDVDPGAGPDDDNSLENRGLSASRLAELCHQIPALKRIVMLDACYSGAAVSNFNAGTPEYRELNLFSSNKGIVFLTSSSGNQVSNSSNSEGHGYFTQGFLTGLRDGEATLNYSNIVTIETMVAHLRWKVPELTGERQQPHFFFPNPLHIIELGKID